MYTAKDVDALITRASRQSIVSLAAARLRANYRLISLHDMLEPRRASALLSAIWPM